jgi:hypothetical protein
MRGYQTYIDIEPEYRPWRVCGSGWYDQNDGHDVPDRQKTSLTGPIVRAIYVAQSLTEFNTVPQSKETLE